MNAHVEIQIRLSLNEDETLHDVLGQFANGARGWTFPVKESEVYQNNIGGAGGYLICAQSKRIKPALIAIATAKTKRPNTFYVANIVPRDCFELTIAEYNAIGLTFVRDLRTWLKKSPFGGNVLCTNEEKTLADIVPGEKCREFFARFLRCDVWNSQTLPSHPSDIEKLDVFICAIFRYRVEVHTDEIERYLIADRKWKPVDATWVRRRIDIGLDVLKMNRRF